ncbi:hypothetical protein [Kitasatospora sp. MBT63]|uniref:hypothetical protein n=1 Tax=Kitasatospora sp. MBT63 TaxID=1444768 RepID=UPI000AA8B545|nr:hypothetical protein [Kitasatospora sp. MBT63]
MADRQRPAGRTAPAAAEAGWRPPEAEVTAVYQPVEVLAEDGTWALGRINAWWRPQDGPAWCRVRILRARTAPRWIPFDPERLVLLPVGGV